MSSRCPTEQVCDNCEDYRKSKKFRKLNLIRKEVNCQTTNVVYGIKCRKCNKIVYVGETERTVAERIKEHLADVRSLLSYTYSYKYFILLTISSIL